LKDQCEQQLDMLDRISDLLEAVLSIDLDDLDQIVQEAHKCTPSQMDEPEERYGVSRQALRMFWLFRRHLEKVDDPIRNDERGRHV